MNIFIGSSTEATKRDAVTTLARWPEESGHTPVIWNQPGLFIPGDHIFTRLLEIGKEVDAAILVFSEDDKLWYQKELANQPRDNVLLEYGLFTGLLGRKKVIVCREGNPKNPSDLHGIVALEFSPEKPNTARTHLIRWVDSVAWEVIKHKLIKALSNPKYLSGYRTITRLAELVRLPEDDVRRILKQHKSELVFDKIKEGDGVRLRTR
jgi:predicted nucleotide-binding protein